AYVIGEAHVFNPDAMKGYGAQVVASVKKYGGRYLARGARPEVLEGGPAHNILVIEFATADTARQWYASPEYQAAKRLRQGNSNLRLLLIEDFVKEPG
ncbi:MAG TPA: DUF1330 domain-containing protein, partial [Xanthobacteraceae bacterium]|nr:DUF1330 domain-containing protein [Xanthobacteraceae bacterium]